MFGLWKGAVLDGLEDGIAQFLGRDLRGHYKQLATRMLVVGVFWVVCLKRPGDAPGCHDGMMHLREEARALTNSPPRYV